MFHVLLGLGILKGSVIFFVIRFASSIVCLQMTMAPVKHRRTSEYIAEPYRKRRKASTQFNTLPIPTDEIGNLLDVENPFPLRLIPSKKSLVTD